MKWLYCLFCLGVMPHYRGMCHSCGSNNGEKNNELEKTVESTTANGAEQDSEVVPEVGDAG